MRTRSTFGGGMKKWVEKSIGKEGPVILDFWRKKVGELRDFLAAEKREQALLSRCFFGKSGGTFVVEACGAVLVG